MKTAKTTKAPPAAEAAPRKLRQPGAYTMKLREDHDERAKLMGSMLRDFLPAVGPATSSLLNLARVLDMAQDEAKHVLDGFAEDVAPEKAETDAIISQLKGASGGVWDLLKKVVGAEDVCGCMLDLDSENQI